MKLLLKNGIRIEIEFLFRMEITLIPSINVPISAIPWQI